MDRKMSLVPAVVAAPNPSAKDEWFFSSMHHHPWFPTCRPESVEIELIFIVILLSQTQSNLDIGHKLIML